MTYYKVVSHKNGIFSSYCTWGQYRVEYKKDRWTNPDIGKLFVFSSLEDVKDFVYHSDVEKGIVHIYECKVQNPEKLDEISVASNWENFWNGERLGLMDTPKGTFVASAVKIFGPNLGESYNVHSD